MTIEFDMEESGEAVLNSRYMKSLGNREPHSTTNYWRRNRPFIGWDGEGYTDESGNHHYALFGSSTGIRVKGKHLTWQECLPLLFQAPKNANHVVFSGTYDIVKMIGDNIGHADRERLMKGSLTFIADYKMRFFKGKFLEITDRRLGQTRILYDVFTFFSKSFVKACQEYLGDLPILDDIQRMKDNRGHFTVNDILDGTEVEEYMTGELKLLVELMTDLRTKLALVGVHPAKWHGPGAVASTVLQKHGISKHMGKYSPEFRLCAEAAYYGGRFEQFQRGTYQGKVYQYDIRSAYPSAMQYLPSLATAQWTHRTGSPHVPNKVRAFDLVHIDYDLASTPRSVENLFHIGHLPYRDSHGRIYFPNHFIKGWYWGVEVPPEFSPFITEYYRPQFSDHILPFGFVQEMYNQRAKLKANNQAEQLALKLALNSIYGKVAQSKGAHINPVTKEWLYPTFHEIVWGGWITAYCRARISKAMHRAPFGSVVATETDSIFSLVPLDFLPVSERLGEWELTVLDGLVYIQSGVSLIRQDGGNWQFKTRGFTLKRNQDEVKIWLDFLASGDAVLKIKQANRFGTDPRTENYGKWYETEYELRLNTSASQKRIHVDKACPDCRKGKSLNSCLHWMSIPQISAAESTPYIFPWHKEYTEEIHYRQMNMLDDQEFTLEYVDGEW